MTVDYNYWKDAYKSSWKVAANKEKIVKEMVEHLANCECDFIGLGAGKTDYFSGSAKDNKHEKGGSDFVVRGTNIYIEVTGPNIDSVGKEADLWIRPDKIEYARNKPEKNCWVLHVLKKDLLIRVIHLNNDFFESYVQNEFRVVNPVIRGRKETYCSIPATSKHVLDFEDLIKDIESTMNS